MKKVITILGTRPETIKLAPVIKELKNWPEYFDSKVCVTGQHREMLDQALASFEIQPDFDLKIMKPNQSLARTTAFAIEKLDKLLIDEKPDLILVQGDTTTSFCGALVGYYHGVAIGHVEAGLRTGNKKSPFPEEINRRLIAPLADYHFAPTESAKRALINEGISLSSIFLTGNTVIDALLWMREKIRNVPPETSKGLLDFIDGMQLILVTGHRRESFGEGFLNICRAIREVADAYKDVVFVYPMHLNPNVRRPVNDILGGHKRIRLLEPLSYELFVMLMDRATIVLTDSGGVQEEAPSLGVPVLVMRETSERPEGIIAGNARLVGVKEGAIKKELDKLLQNPDERELMGKVNNPYGDGNASKKIVEILAQEIRI